MAELQFLGHNIAYWIELDRRSKKEASFDYTELLEDFLKVSRELGVANQKLKRIKETIG